MQKIITDSSVTDDVSEASVHSSSLPASRAQWFEYFRKYKEGTLGQRAFCEQEGLPYSRFAYYWRAYRELKKKGNRKVRFQEISLSAGLSDKADLPKYALEVRLPDGTVFRGEEVSLLGELIRNVSRR